MNTHFTHVSAIIRVQDVYGRHLWLSKTHYDSGKVMIPICKGDGMKRSYTLAGEKDGQNLMHRDNIATVKQTRTFPPTT